MSEPQALSTPFNLVDTNAMQFLTQNITAVFGEYGRKWLDLLPKIIEHLSAHWTLSQLTPVNNMTFHYVAKAHSQQYGAVVLKIGLDAGSLLQERHALDWFHGEGAVHLLDCNEKYQALLLQQAIPGESLAISGCAEQSKITHYLNLLDKLHRTLQNPSDGYPHIKDWLRAIEQVETNRIPLRLLYKASSLTKELLTSQEPVILLHGDLHHDNVLSHGDKWLAIDPKPVYGERAFEIRCIDFLSERGRLLSSQLFIQQYTHIVELVSAQSGLNAQKLVGWDFVRMVLAAVWSVQDHSCPLWAIKHAQAIESTDLLS